LPVRIVTNIGGWLAPPPQLMARAAASSVTGIRGRLIGLETGQSWPFVQAQKTTMTDRFGTGAC
jgi:hypothetical protein